VAEKLAQMRLHGGAFGGGHGVVPSKLGCAGIAALVSGCKLARLHRNVVHNAPCRTLLNG
ncbi:MAG: hypothetical protein ACKPAC_12565, partial [Alphaproteobacteria bacterium]